MRSSETRGLICMDGPFDVVYDVCAITYTVWDDGSFEYVFEPRYAVIDLLGAPDFQGIPGLDLTLRKRRYVRRNRVPVFVEERSPSPNREGLWQLLDEEGMDHLNRLEWLIRTDMRYGGDKLYVRRYEDFDGPRRIDEEQVIAGSQNTELAMKALLQALARGDKIMLRDGRDADGAERKVLHDALVLLLDKGEKYRQKRCEDDPASARGRRRIVVEDTRLDEALRDMANGKLTSDEAAARLGVSRATFFRRKREWEQGASSMPGATSS